MTQGADDDEWEQQELQVTHGARSASPSSTSRAELLLYREGQEPPWGA